MKIIANISYWESFAAQARIEAQRLAREADELIANAKATLLEAEKEKERINEAARKIENGNGYIFSVDFISRRFIG